EHQKRKDEICPFSSLADFNPLQLTKSRKISRLENSLMVPNLEIFYFLIIATNLLTSFLKVSFLQD
ncbi:hypothetical protein, partial [Streptococcus pneumoniae]|uniref:hypothetical protein n=1 Tax=Streptococcus pneumoniae TaxID=1313 RepID=UPI001154FDDA